jgi:hypothetical protein
MHIPTIPTISRQYENSSTGSCELARDKNTPVEVNVIPLYGHFQNALCETERMDKHLNDRYRGQVGQKPAE